jgi:hypothetical protein
LLVSVVQIDNGLVFRTIGGPPERPLIPTSATTFAFPGEPGEIRFVVDGDNVSLVLRGAPFPPAPKLATPDLSEAALAKYTGRYESAELDTWFAIRAGANGLELRRRYGPWARIEPVAPDRFFTGPAELRFERDGNSNPTGFVVLTQRASNIRFERVADAAVP